jgi:hypothetical protein
MRAIELPNPACLVDQLERNRVAATLLYRNDPHLRSTIEICPLVRDITYPCINLKAPLFGDSIYLLARLADTGPHREMGTEVTSSWPCRPAN